MGVSNFFFKFNLILFQFNTKGLYPPYICKIKGERTESLKSFHFFHFILLSIFDKNILQFQFNYTYILNIFHKIDCISLTV